MQKKSSKQNKKERFANISDTLFDQKSLVHRDTGFPLWHTQTQTQQPNISTLRLNRPIGPIQGKWLFQFPGLDIIVHFTKQFIKLIQYMPPLAGHVK